MSDSFSSQQRVKLSKRVTGLPPAQFDQLVFALHPPNGIIPGNAAPQGLRSAALLQWAESLNGPGLGSVERTLEQVLTCPPATVLSPGMQSERAKMLQRLEHDTNVRLKNSLHELIKINLQVEIQHQRVRQSGLELIPEDSTDELVEKPQRFINRRFRPLGKPAASHTELAPTQSLLSVLEDSGVYSRLLILGEPGAGKTTELVALAYDLLERTAKNALEPIPIIFELSSWQEGKLIDQWLVEQCKRIYRLTESISKQWLKAKQIFLLLDGLDELGLEKQRKCIEAINKFLRNTEYPYAVVCCKQEQYEAGQAELSELGSVVYLKSLTDQQIQDYLKDLNRSSLWQTIETNSELLDLAHQPLFLTMFVVAYQGQAIRNVSDLFNVYIEARLTESSHRGVYPPGKTPSSSETKRYLAWLARQMSEVGKIEYLIEEMQPSWLSQNCRNVYMPTVFLSCGLLLGLPISLSLALLSLLTGSNVNLLVVLFFGMTFGFLGSSIRISEIRLSERVIWSTRDALMGRQGRGMLRRLFSGLVFGLSLGLVSELFGWRSFGLIEGLLFGLASGLIGGVIIGFYEGLSSLSVETRSLPNQGIRRSLHNSVKIMLLVGSLLALLLGLIGWLLGGPGIGLIIGLIVGPSLGLPIAMKNGLEASIKHLTLRFLLAKEGCFPWDCVLFLEYTAKLGFIQRIGGRYRFMHDLLHKFFADGNLPRNL